MNTIIHLHIVGGSGVMPTACGTFTSSTGVPLSMFNHQITGEPRAVNCHNCKMTQAFKDAMAKLSAQLGGRLG